MARPRADQPGPTAQERIIEAFWGMLTEMPFPNIKVAALARRAKVSPNTLYYHFDNISHIAERALQANLDAELARAMLAGDSSSVARMVTDLGGRFGRVLLFARSGSAEMVGTLTAALRRLWLGHFGLNEASLDPAARRDLAFIFGGAVAMLGDTTLTNEADEVAAFLTRPLGSGARATLANLIATHGSPQPAPAET